VLGCVWFSFGCDFCARQGKLDRRLGKTSASPEQGSDLDIRSEGIPTSPSTGTLTHPVSRLFTHTEALLQQLQYGHPFPWGLGRTANPSPSASALSRKTASSSQQRNARSYHPQDAKTSPLGTRWPLVQTAYIS
jgi:outer membrane receptor for monomeric catechols